MSILRKLATLVFILAVPVALVTTTIRIVFNEPRVYEYAIDEYNAVQTTGFARAELLRAGNELREYLNSSGEDRQLRIQVVRDNHIEPLYTPREISHLADVRDRLIWMNRVQLLSVLYVLTYMSAVVLWSREVSLRGLAWATAAASVLTLAAVGAAAALSMSGFEVAWEQFHEVFFTDNYRFNPLTDRLIQIYPDRFWESITFFIGVMIAAEALLLLVGSIIYLGVTGHRQPARRLRQSQAAA